MQECRSGFIYAAGARIAMAISCPYCKKNMCHLCKKPVSVRLVHLMTPYLIAVPTLQWEDQHANTTCEQFAQWKQAMDPDAQKQGLAAHLNANGIGKLGNDAAYSLYKSYATHCCPWTTNLCKVFFLTPASRW